MKHQDPWQNWDYMQQQPKMNSVPETYLSDARTSSTMEVGIGKGWNNGNGTVVFMNLWFLVYSLL